MNEISEADIGIKSLRREVRMLFNRCRANNSQSWELYSEAQRRYRKEVRKASKETSQPLILSRSL